MGRLTEAKSAADYFGAGIKATKPGSPSSPQQQQQQPGLRRFLSLFRGSQLRQPEEAPTGRSASSFIVAWRSTRAPPDILTLEPDVLSLEHEGASASVAGQPAPLCDSAPLDVVSSEYPRQELQEPPSLQLLKQHAMEEHARALDRGRMVEQTRRELQALKLQELQRQATLKDRAGPEMAPPTRLEYQPQASMGRGGSGGELEVLRLGPSDDCRQERGGLRPQTPVLTLTPQRDNDQQPQRQQQQVLRQEHRLSLEEPLRLQTQALRQALIPTPQEQMQHRSDGMCKDSSHELLRLPHVGHATAAVAAGPASAGTTASAGPSLRQQPPVSTDATVTLHQMSSPGQWKDPDALTVDADPRVSVQKVRAEPTTPGEAGANGPATGLVGPATSRAYIGVGSTVGVAPPGSGSCSHPLSLGNEPQPQEPSPRSQSSISMPQLTAWPSAHFMLPPSPRLLPPSALVSPSPAQPGTSAAAVPALEVTLLSLAPAAPASPTMDIILGAGPPRVAVVTAGGDSLTMPTIMRQRSIRTPNGTGCGGGAASDGLGAPFLTAEVALLTSANPRGPTSPVRRRVSTPSGAGGDGGGGGLHSGGDAVVRRMTTLPEAVVGGGGEGNTLQSVFSLRHSCNGIAAACGDGAAAAAAVALQGDAVKGATVAAAAAGGDGARVSVVPPLGRSVSQQRIPSASGSGPAERTSNWEFWKRSSRGSNWGLWKSQSNLSSRVRLDLENRAAEVAIAAQGSPGSGANSSLPSCNGCGISSSTTAPYWKQMLEKTAAALKAADDVCTAVGGGGGGGGSDRPYDGMPPARALTRAATMRNPRPATPAAKTGRMLLRVASQPPTMISLAASGQLIDDGDDSSVERSEGWESSVAAAAQPPTVATPALVSPRAGRLSAVAPAGAASPPPPPSPLPLPLRRERSPTSMTAATAALPSPPPPQENQSGGCQGALIAGAEPAATGRRRPARLSLPNAAIGSTPAPPPPPRFAPSPPGAPSSPLPPAVPAATTLSPALPATHRVSFMGGGAACSSSNGSCIGGGAAAAAASGWPYETNLESLRSGAQHGRPRPSDSGVVVAARDGEAQLARPAPLAQPAPPAGDVPKRISLSGLAVNARSRRVVYAAGGSGDQPQMGTSSGLVPLLPPPTSPPPQPSQRDGASPEGASAPLPHLPPLK